MLAKVKAFVLLALMLVLPCILCAQPQKGNARSGPAGLEGKWYLQAVLISDTAAGMVPEIIFDVRRGHFSGNTGCNAMRGNFRATDTSIAFDERVVTTKRMCVGYNEGAFLKNLVRCNSYKIQNGLLVLMVDGTEISRWGRKPAKQKIRGLTLDTGRGKTSAGGCLDGSAPEAFIPQFRLQRFS
jgi:hypothetical protein